MNKFEKEIIDYINGDKLKAVITRNIELSALPMITEVVENAVKRICKKNRINSDNMRIDINPKINIDFECGGVIEPKEDV